MTYFVFIVFILLIILMFVVLTNDKWTQWIRGETDYNTSTANDIDNRNQTIIDGEIYYPPGKELRRGTAKKW